MKSLSSVLALVPFALASPALLKRVDTSQVCGQYDTVTAGNYELLTDLWGESDATSGSQCSQITSQSGSDIAWTTTWTWTGGSSVKSFSNIQLNEGINVQLSTISSMPTTWDWSYAYSGTIVADVAYDTFTSATSGGSAAYEIMVWMANYNAGPISATYGSDGSPTPIASDITIGSYTWNLYSGSNGSNAVYSFLPTSGDITSFSGDLYAFFQYLIDNEGLSSSQYLTTAQGGTEPTSGSDATLTTTQYSLAIN
ncbi:hypothetical protein CONPUDRAFT_159157 [Coniophora puteana RWD-64-598 SS2]|uniref:Glycoside hydrolase family 12 protein n=1 Tax=Coniophora puteana (strain RWD-64-598) TaxID=741705 RepID=A0A5M3MAW2_CONPW|nr:uncharacterized protein CONPUDRAFT_159157 [Coniophora puteana RWD-64-598 SS2]EIW75755.1 hypothetical protein CONPUDRAFT_159157 [Coniophora puteana RWD-64-598 SS2]